MFNHWFAQWAIPTSITKVVISLLKKGGKYIWEGLDDYRPVTLLKTKLKILAQILANRLRIVVGDLIRPEQNYAVKRSIQNNLDHIDKQFGKNTTDRLWETICEIFLKNTTWSWYWNTCRLEICLQTLRRRIPANFASWLTPTVNEKTTSGRFGFKVKGPERVNSHRL